MNIEHLYREESGRILATLIRLLGDFDLAEEVVQEAFVAALEQWPAEGLPAHPRAWLVSTARHKAVDHLRRRTRFQEKQKALEQLVALEEQMTAPDPSDSMVADDRLRLIFTCCHPALAIEAQVALTLRTLGGLSTEEIARAFLVPLPTMAQRLVRAKQKIRAAGIPYQIPPDDLLPERLDGVLQTVYLVFNEGYAATLGDTLVRRELCAEAIRLGRLLCELLPACPDACALLALMLLHDSRRDARINAEGEIILLEEQDRGRWNRAQIHEGLTLLETAFRLGGPSEYTLQAAIAALHAQADRAESTDWRQIAQLYNVLLRIQPSPVVELNRAVAVAMANGFEHGLRLITEIEARGELHNYHLLPASRADLLRRLGRWAEAAAAYRHALSLVTNDTERRFLKRRLAEVEGRRL
ncbi:MAG TPA: RNA polymerase sigma factor [Candidatus Binatia bacterium]|nr:RNA polymerase sigma factor [Candidatus Binatia bacterium]